MTLSLLLWLAPAVLLTSLLSGVVGMAGGMILMAVLVAFMPVAAAMVIHGVTQMAANGWRALMWRRYVDWSVVRRCAVGLVLAVALLSIVRYVPERGAVLIAVGLLPFVILAIPARLTLQVDQRWGAELCGLLNGVVNLMAGVSGPLLDIFFVRTTMDRRAVVATKAACQTLAHAGKLIYFGIIVGSLQAEAIDATLLASCVFFAVAGTMLSRVVLERLSDVHFRLWTRRIIMAVGVGCTAQGVAFYLK